MSYNRMQIDIDECIDYIIKQVVEFNNCICLFNEHDAVRQQSIEELEQQISKLENAKSVRNNSYNYSIEELEERVQSLDSSHVSIDTYSLIYTYIDLLRNAIRNLENIGNWDRIIHYIEENDNFSSFRKRYSNSTELLKSFHYSEFFHYTEDDIKEILSSGFFVNQQKKNAQMKLYSLYADFKNFYKKEILYRTIEKENKKYNDAIRNIDAWMQAQKADLNQKLSQLYAERLYSDKVSSAKRACLNNIYKTYNPETISGLCRENSISHTEYINDSNGIINREIAYVIPPYIELYTGHKVLFKYTHGHDDMKELIREIVSSYNELFCTNNNYDYLGVQTPVKAYLDRKSNNFMFRLLDLNRAFALTYSIANYLWEHCFYPIQYYCCGKDAEKMLFLETKGAKCFTKPLPVLQDVFDIMIRREEKLREFSFYDSNNRLLFDGDNPLQLIVLFIFDYDSDEIIKSSGKEIMNELLRRGQRMGILVIRITDQTSFDKDYRYFYKGNVWIEQKDHLFINNNISIELTELHDIKSSFSFKKKESRIFKENQVFPKRIIPNFSTEPQTFQNRLGCPIGVTYDLQEKELDISMYHNFLYIMGDAYSGRSSAARIILKSIVNKYSESVQLYIVDLSIGGIEYSRYKYVNSSAIKMLAFDCGCEVVQATLMIVIQEIRRLADIFRYNQVSDYREYAQKTNQNIQHIIVFIDGTEYLDMQSVQMLKEVIDEGVRYNIQVVLVGNEIQELKIISRSRVTMGLNYEDRRYASERKGMSKLEVDEKAYTVQWYYDKNPYSLNCDQDNNSTYVICRDAIERPKSLISCFINDEISILNEEGKIIIDFGNDLNAFEEVIPVSNIQLSKKKERENILIVGGSENHIDAILSNIIANLLIYKQRYNKKASIILLSPISNSLRQIASVFSDQIIVAGIEQYVEISINSEDREVFILIDNYNANASFAFDPFNNEFQVEAAGRFIQECLTNKHTHIIAWCDDPNNVHPILSQGNSFLAFLRLFSHQIHLRIARERFEFRDLGIFNDCMNMSDNEAWIYTEKTRKLVYPYRRISNRVWNLIANKIRS